VRLVEQFDTGRGTYRSVGVRRQPPDWFSVGSLVRERRDPENSQDRLLADLALTYGAFHRYLCRPYQAGTFRKGAHGRIKAIIKAGLATAAIIKLLSNAEKNAAADPTLCKFVPSMGTIKASLSSLAAKIRGGTATSSDANSTSSLFEQLKSGTGFTPAGNALLPGLG
jgi:hypothetical protein